MQHLFWYNPDSNPSERLQPLNQILNAYCPTFHFVYGPPIMFLFGRSTYLVSGPYLLCSSYAIFTIRQLDHGAGSGILRQRMFRFQQMRVFFKA